MCDGLDNPLVVAEKWGESIGGNLVSRAMMELELAFAGGLLPRFENNPLIRVRQNLLLYWDQSFLKSSSIGEFTKVLPGSIRFADITSMTPQMLFGSISNERDYIVKPAFAGIRFALITELLSFLGQGSTQREVVNTINKIMEHETVARYLLKLGQLSFDQVQLSKLKAEGIAYHPQRARLSYKPDVTILAASRPMPNRTYTYLRGSGHLYRYHVLQRRISDEEARQFFRKNFHPDLKLRAQLKQLNERMMGVSVKQMELPSSKVLSEILDPLEEIARDEIRGRKIRLATIIDVRTKGDVVRELASHALLRMASQNDFQTIGTLEYTDEDVEFLLRDVGHFIESRIDPLFVEDFSVRITKKRPRERVKEIVLELLQDGKIAGRSEIDEHILEEMPVSKATISNALADLLQEHKIQQPKFGLYRMGEK